MLVTFPDSMKHYRAVVRNGSWMSVQIAITELELKVKLVKTPERWWKLITDTARRKFSPLDTMQFEQSGGIFETFRQHL
jgi:hypothetical protein